MYLVVKTSLEEVEKKGSLYEAGRGHWYINPFKAEKCSHAIITLRGSRKIKAVYKISDWKKTFSHRYQFEGVADIPLSRALVGKFLNSNLFKRGQRNPVSYIEENNLLENYPFN